ncbi:MAG: PEP-CTERM sorting domain-containing protein [Massilia sp.]
MYVTSGSRVVGAGIEFLGNLSGSEITYFDVDLSNAGITLTYHTNVTWSGASFNGVKLTDLTKAFDPLTFVSSTNAAFTAANFSVAGNVASFNWQGISFNNGDQIVISAASAVPEPRTVSLMLACLAILAFVSRRRKV